MLHERFIPAAELVLSDDSMQAANNLEGVVIEEYLDDERLDDLLLALSLYNPSEGPPYVDGQGLRAAVRDALALLAADTA